jgi:uncharacterized protein (DUF983 family)
MRFLLIVVQWRACGTVSRPVVAQAPGRCPGRAARSGRLHRFVIRCSSRCAAMDCTTASTSAADTTDLPAAPAIASSDAVAQASASPPRKGITYFVIAFR